MTPVQILRAWERALLIFAEECYNAHCVFSAATPTSDATRLVLTYAEPKTKIDIFNVETATRNHFEITLKHGFARACEELELDAERIPIVIRVDGADEPAPELEPVAPELPPHDEAPAAADFTKAQRAAAAAYNIAQLSGVMLTRFAETNPDAVLELADDLDTYTAARKRPDTATGYPPNAERRIALLFAKLAP